MLDVGYSPWGLDIFDSGFDQAVRNTVALHSRAWAAIGPDHWRFSRVTTRHFKVTIVKFVICVYLWG